MQWAQNEHIARDGYAERAGDKIERKMLLQMADQWRRLANYNVIRQVPFSDGCEWPVHYLLGEHLKNQKSARRHQDRNLIGVAKL